MSDQDVHKLESPDSPVSDEPQLSISYSPVVDPQFPIVAEVNLPATFPEDEELPEKAKPAAASDRSVGAPQDDACAVVVKEDATPRGRKMADQAREVAAAHASLLVDIEACKRVSMTRR